MQSAAFHEQGSKLIYLKLFYCSRLDFHILLNFHIMIIDIKKYDTASVLLQNSSYYGKEIHILAWFWNVTFFYINTDLIFNHQDVEI